MDELPTPEFESALAGFRLVRRIGTGSQSRVYLGQATRGRSTTAQENSLSVAVKVFRLDAETAALDRQVRAMLRLPPGMLAPLRDLARAPDGRLCLVMDRLGGPSLHALFAERSRIGAGEAVTIAATITATLQALHDAGFSHPMITSECVRLDRAGRPVLLGLGALEELPAGGAGVGRRRDDLVRLAGWVRSVLEHVDPRSPEAAEAEAVLAEFEAAATSRPLPVDLTAVEAALFAWAPATAVRDTAVHDTAVHDTAVHDTAVHETTDPETTRAVSLTRPARSAVQARGRAVESRDAVWTALVRRGTEGAVALRQWRRQGDRVRPARSGGRRLLVRPALVGVCLAGVLSMGGLILVSGSVSPAASGEPTGRTASAAPSSEASSSGASATAEPAKNRDDGEHTRSPESSAALLGDDPAAATVLLLVMRERCLAAASMLCLDGVDQAGSVAMAADSYLVRQVSGGAPTTDGPPGNAVLDQSPFTATVQERRGNAALIILTPTDTGSPRTQPASALVIKGEAGWRLRELFDY